MMKKNYGKILKDNINKERMLFFYAFISYNRVRKNVNEVKLELTALNAILMILTTFVASIILVPIFKKVAFHIGAVDEPNKRRLNKVAMPTIGGVAVFLSFLLGYMIFMNPSKEMNAILIASFIILLTGFIDDIKPISAKYQLLGQLAAICTLVFYGNITIDVFTIPNITMNLAFPWNSLVTIIFMIGIINAIDLSDGMDGLSSGISIIYFVTILIIASIIGTLGNLDSSIAILMIGALLGFLVYNFPPAKIYIGDSGSNFMGLMVATTAICGYKLATFTSLIVPLAILATPIIDVVFSIIRRSLKKENPFTTPDKEHLHHQLLKLKFSTKTSLMIIYSINLLFSAVSILYVLNYIEYALILYVLLMILFLFIVLKTDIVFPHRKDKKNE